MSSEVGPFDVVVYGAVPKEVLAGNLPTTQVAHNWEAPGQWVVWNSLDLVDCLGFLGLMWFDVPQLWFG